MADTFDEKVCDERHERINKDVDDLWRHNGDLVKAINGKFNKIMFGLYGVLLSVIGSLVIIILTRK
jgi:hypothetical protein